MLFFGRVRVRKSSLIARLKKKEKMTRQIISSLFISSRSWVTNVCIEKWLEWLDKREKEKKRENIHCWLRHYVTWLFRSLMKWKKLNVTAGVTGKKQTSWFPHFFSIIKFPQSIQRAKDTRLRDCLSRSSRGPRWISVGPHGRGGVGAAGVRGPGKSGAGGKGNVNL